MANLITLGRLALLFGTVALLFSGNYGLIVLSVILIFVVFAGDALDGYVARWRGSSSALGAVLDIAGDRIVENVYWITFAQLGLIGIWAPLLVLTRGFFVDALRSVAYAAGRSAFGPNSMARYPLTRFLTASRFMRAFYGVAKLLGFLFLGALVAARQDPGSALGRAYGSDALRALGWFMVYAALALTVIRGLPVVVDAMYYLRQPPSAHEEAQCPEGVEQGRP